MYQKQTALLYEIVQGEFFPSLKRSIQFHPQLPVTPEQRFANYILYVCNSQPVITSEKQTNNQKKHNRGELEGYSGELGFACSSDRAAGATWALSVKSLSEARLDSDTKADTWHGAVAWCHPTRAVLKPAQPLPDPGGSKCWG